MMTVILRRSARFAGMVGHRGRDGVLQPDVLVVMLYANEGVDNDANTHIWLQHVVDWATPIRMPAFFLISGLLLSASIQRD